jgi:lipopolysaccharide biosynthesis glycosyltransferase
MKSMPISGGQQRVTKIEMNILVAINSTYVLPLIVMLESLFDNNSDINIYLLYSDLTSAELKYLDNFIKSKGSIFIPLKIADNTFSDAPTLKYISKETYYRLLAAEILPSSVDRLLWLDADLIVVKNIKNFYHTDFSDKYLVACSYGTPMKKTIEGACKRLELPDSSQYFNAGVLLFNMEKLRTVEMRKMINHCLESGRPLTFLDQDISNLIFYNQVKIEDYRYYNAMIHCIASPEEQHFMRENATIIHFPGEAKPWKFNDLPFSDLWFHYYNRSPYGKNSLRRTSYFHLKAVYQKMQIAKSHIANIGDRL